MGSAVSPKLLRQKAQTLQINENNETILSGFHVPEIGRFTDGGGSGSAWDVCPRQSRPLPGVAAVVGPSVAGAAARGVAAAAVGPAAGRLEVVPRAALVVGAPVVVVRVATARRARLQAGRRSARAATTARRRGRPLGAAGLSAPRQHVQVHSHQCGRHSGVQN